MGQEDTQSSGKVGLICGLALKAGIHYYERIAERHAKLGIPASIIINHADIGRVLAAVAAGDREALGAYLGRLANDLFQGGASFVAITAVAPHIAVDAMARASLCPIVSVLDSLASGISDEGLRRVAIFGNRAVMLTNAFGALRPETVVPLRAAEIELVHSTYTDIALHGKRGTERERRLLATLAGELFSRGAEAIVLAGTDLSSFYSDERPDYPFLDAAELHMEAIMNRVLLDRRATGPASEGSSRFRSGDAGVSLG